MVAVAHLKEDLVPRKSNISVVSKNQIKLLHFADSILLARQN